MINMPYSTPASLQVTGQGVSFLPFFSFFLGALSPGEVPLDSCEMLEATPRSALLRPGASNLSLL